MPALCPRRRVPALVALVALAAVVPMVLPPSSGAVVGPRVSFVFRQGEPAGQPVENVFPFNDCSQRDPADVNDLQALMYRPLYWFGLGASLAVQPTLSIANAPTYAAPSGGGFRQVTIQLKHWAYSNGEVVTAESVAFFLNLWRAESANLCGSFVGDGIPSDVASVSMPLGLGGDEIVLDFSSPVNPTWMTENFLAAIVPFPKAWDRTSITGLAGSGGCGSGTWAAPLTTSRCRSVYGFLEARGAHPATYAASPIWRVVDGPYRVSSGTNAGQVVLVPNTAYSGPVRSKLHDVVLVPYPTAAAEQAALAAHALQAGDVATSALGPSHAVGTPGPNLRAGIRGAYTPRWDPSWQSDFVAYNFAGTDPELGAIDQPFVRQALQEAIDEPAIIAAADRGYATPTCSPIPYAAGAPNPCPNAYSPSGVRTLLQGNGFTYSTSLGAWSCSLVAGCGAGIPQGYELTFKLVYTQGDPGLATDVGKDVAYWRAAGIPVTATAATPTAVILGCSGATYSLCDYIGWNYLPALDPTGEEILGSGGQENFGGYADATMDSLIAATTSGAATTLGAYASYAAAEDPLLWQPSPVGTSELERSCVGALAPNAYGDFMPEYVSHC